MPDESDKTITFQVRIALAVRGGVAPLVHRIDGVSITPSYPKVFNFLGTEQPFPYQMATLFDVEWNQPSTEKLEEWIRLRHIPVWNPILHAALWHINRLLSAYKYAGINHILGGHLRTVGEADLFYYSAKMNGEEIPPLRGSGVFSNFFHDGQHLIEVMTEDGPEKVDFTHSGHHLLWEAGKYLSGVPPVGGRVIRCIELSEHGYHSESVIVAHATLDDMIQRMLREQLVSKGLSESDAKSLIRSIKEDRWAKYLGPLLKSLSGKSLSEMWPEGVAAAQQVNKWRNDLAHAGSEADTRTAHLCCYFVAKCIAVLHKEGLIPEDLEYEVFNYVEILASRTKDPPAWVPRGK